MLCVTGVHLKNLTCFLIILHLTVGHLSVLLCLLRICLGGPWILCNRDIQSALDAALVLIHLLYLLPRLSLIHNLPLANSQNFTSSFCCLSSVNLPDQKLACLPVSVCVCDSWWVIVCVSLFLSACNDGDCQFVECIKHLWESLVDFEPTLMCMILITV